MTRPGGKRKKVLSAAVGHALDFDAWRQLARNEGLIDPEAVDLMVELIRSAAGTRR